ncbi:MAG: exported protein of unknown function, partial [Hyphomicrobiales bacterium]|nr:exported protein of unknown function [Hyphomicrobiales bacterium]
MRTILLAAILAGVALPAHAQLDSVPERTRDWAQKQVENFVAIWSRDEDVNAQSVERLYAPRAVYYGKSMSRAAILADKRAYIARWPQRRYEIVPGSVDVSCTAGNAMCKATGTLRWTRADRTGREVRGASRMSFLVSRESGGKIVRES